MSERTFGSSTTSPDVDRRGLLKKAAGAVTGAAMLSGTAGAHGKGVSWVAFCGCDYWRIRCATGEGDEFSRVWYTAKGDDCRVFFKAGRPIYEVEVHRWDDRSGGWFETGYPRAREVEDAHPSDSRAPCKLVDDAGLDGTKVESHEIEEMIDPDCPGPD